jgi:uncharacterized membrane protein
MTTEELLLFLHVLGAFLYVVGLTAVQVPLARAQRAPSWTEKGEAIEEASHYQGVLLVPGAIAAAATGVVLWSYLEYNLITTPWLLVVELLFLVSLLMCLPVVGVALNRGRIAALMLRKGAARVETRERDGALEIALVDDEGVALEPATPVEPTAAQKAALSDPTPLAFAGLATLLVPVMAFLSITQPF